MSFGNPTNTSSTTLLAACFALATLAAAACGDDTSETTGTTGTAPTTTTGGSGGEGAQAGGGAGGATGGGGAGGATGGGGAGGGTGGGGAGGGSNECGGPNNIPCGATEFCDYPDDLCGEGVATGTCAPQPTACTDEVEPACGCDGAVGSNGCEVQVSGVDLDADGECAAPGGTFACGPHFCELASEYCSITANDTPDPPPFFYSCNTLPAACNLVAVPTCTCAVEATTACFGTCEMDPSGGVIIHCAGG